MNSITYRIGKRKIVVTDKYILNIVKKVENLEMNPYEATKKLEKYLLFDKSIEVGEFFERVSLWEAIVTEFDKLCRGRLTSINERYAEKHGLSGKLII